jgi:thioredoxin-related protein
VHGHRKTGVQFFHGTYQEAVTKARLENKILFVDFYTSWCGPCKKLVKETFPNKELGDFFSDHFICLKIDVEKDDPVTAKKFNVNRFPTLLFLNTEEEIISRTEGFMQAFELVKLGKIVLGKTKSFAVLKKEYESGNRDKGFLQDFIIKARIARHEESNDLEFQNWLTKVTTEYLSSQKPKYLMNPADFKLFADLPQAVLQSHELLNHIYNNFEHWAKVIGDQNTKSFVLSLHQVQLYSLARDGKEFVTELDWMKNRLKEVYKGSGINYLTQKHFLTKEFHINKKDVDGYINYTKNAIDTKSRNHSLIAADYYMVKWDIQRMNVPCTDNHKEFIFGCVKKAFDMEPDNREVMYAYVSELERRNMNQEAILVYKKLLEIEKGTKRESEILKTIEKLKR